MLTRCPRAARRFSVGETVSGQNLVKSSVQRGIRGASKQRPLRLPAVSLSAAAHALPARRAQLRAVDRV
jgi:hypothetical protein